MTEPLTAKDLQRDLDKLKAFGMRLKGESYDRIGRELKVCRVTAIGYVKDYIDRLASQEYQNLLHLRSVELARLDDLIRRAYLDLEEATDILSEDGKLYRDGVRSRSIVMQVILKLVQEKAKILGLYAPERIEQLIVTQEEDESIDYSRMTTEELREALFKSLK